MDSHLNQNMMWDVNKFPMDHVLDPLYNCQIEKKKWREVKGTHYYTECLD